MPRKKRLYGKTRTISLLKTSLELCSWVIRGSTRKFVLFSIKNKATPSEIVNRLAEHRRKSASHYAQVSRALTELKAQKLVKCLNPKEKTGRFYKLTKKGKEILNKIP